MDSFKYHEEGLNSPADNFFSITPANAPLIAIPRAIYIGGAGNLVVTSENGNQVTFEVQAGQMLPIRPHQVNAATTATGIIGLY